MEIFLSEIEELFKGTECHYYQTHNKRFGVYTVGNVNKITLREACEYTISGETLIITKLDISNLPIERQIRISELFESRKKGELTIY